MKTPSAYRYTDSFGTHYTDDYNEILDTPGIEDWAALYEQPGIDLIDLRIRPSEDEHHVWIASLKELGEGGEFSKTAVNAALRAFYDKNI
jgi:hypothetical protein